ncbi:MAG: Tm-1-like ATP-binding domain-containing protein [Deltaproteobacteria bacterium]|nr:Tm-1-like ATP-binding domain-containing protein [Deltaproteobacteria bacterium]
MPSKKPRRTQKTILIIANLDTRGSEFKLVKELIESRGHQGLLLDFSMDRKPYFPGDITCEEVARAGGLTIREVRHLYRTNRDQATENQIAGARKFVQRLLEEGKIHGVLGVGGATSAMVATRIMRSLPLGMPKLMASSIASHPRYGNRYVGTKDITMLNTVVDVVELNPILKIQLTNAVGAICGMVELSTGWEPDFDRPVVAVTSFGMAERCVEPAIHYLREKGYIAVPCHAQGQGDRAMDEMIREGLFRGVIDFVPRGIGEELLGGNSPGGNDRLLAASQCGLPQVVAPSGLEMLGVGGRPDLLKRYAQRPRVVIDKLRTLVRTNARECRRMAAIIAERLNEAQAPCAFLVPLKGWSFLNKEGRPFYDPRTDRAFVAELKRRLRPDIPVIEVNAHLNTPQFGKKAVELFHRLFTQWQQNKK